MYKLLLLLLIISFSLGCASQKPIFKETIFHKMEYIQVPLWAYSPPAQSDYVIGISTKSFDEEAMRDAARQMAAVMKSRNTGSYTIEKFAMTTTSNIIKDGKSVFKLNVGSPEEAERIYNSLHLVDEAYLYDFYLGLFSESQTEIAESYKEKRIFNFPDWYKKDQIIDEGNIIISYASDRSYNLVTAWEKTAEKARFGLAKYLEKDIQGALISKDEEIDKRIAIESTRKLAKMHIKRSFIVTEIYDSLIGYKVYLEMEMKK